MKIYLISLGCAKNRVDSEVIIGNLVNNNEFELVSDIDLADLIIINTCAFIEAAKEEAINTIFDCVNVKKEHQKLIVCGCLSTRYENEIKNLIPEVDRFISIKEYPKFTEIVNSLYKDHPLSKEFDFENRYLTSHICSVYVKISEGCNNRCSYCAIPLIRGKFRSRNKESIIYEVNELVKKGAKEINLISQDTTNYGVDLYDDYQITELLKDLVAINGDFKIRLLYLYPNLVSDKLINFIKENEKVMPYFDIPLQHSEDKMLLSMNRRGDKKFIKELLTKIRNLIPHAILRTTFIVGFPGEDETDFNNLIAFVKDVKFDRLGAFSYSKEEDTKGYSMTNQIPEDIKKQRLEALYLVQDEIALERNMLHVGKYMETLIIDYDAENYAYVGRSYAFAPDDIDGAIYVYSTDELKIGEVYSVKIVNASINFLEGVISQ